MKRLIGLLAVFVGACLASGCAVTSPGVHFKGGLGPAAKPVATWHVKIGAIDAAVEAPGLAEVPE